MGEERQLPSKRCWQGDVAALPGFLERMLGELDAGDGRGHGVWRGGVGFLYLDFKFFTFHLTSLFYLVCYVYTIFVFLRLNPLT